MSRVRTWSPSTALASAAIALSFAFLVACSNSDSGSSSAQSQQRAVEFIAAKIEPNDLGIVNTNLAAKDNQFGAGILVFTARSDAPADIPLAVWLVVDEEAYPLGIPAHLATPSLPCPCNAPQGFWESAGLNPYQSALEFEALVLGPGS
jgi:hypothetical protein